MQQVGKKITFVKSPGIAGPGRAGLLVKQLHGYSDGRTCSWVIVRWLEWGDLQQHFAPLSYPRSVATIHGLWRGKHYFPSLPLCAEWEGVDSNPETSKRFFLINLFLEGLCFSTRTSFPLFLPSMLFLPSNATWNFLPIFHFNVMVKIMVHPNSFSLSFQSNTPWYL